MALRKNTKMVNDCAKHKFNANKLILFLFLPAFAIAQNNSQKEVPFSYKEFINLVNFFDSKKDVIEFFDFKEGDIIADIGAGEGKYEGAFSLLFDSIHFYIEDIDQKTLTQNNLNKMVKHYSSIKGFPQTNKFQLCIGTEKATNLPDGVFDKIIMLSSFHEFTFMNEMIDDISKKLKQDGKVYIVDAFCNAKGHVNYTSEEIVSRMKNHGFVPLKMKGINKNNSEGLFEAVFKKSN